MSRDWPGINRSSRSGAPAMPCVAVLRYPSTVSISRCVRPGCGRVVIASAHAVTGWFAVFVSVTCDVGPVTRWSATSGNSAATR